MLLAMIDCSQHTLATEFLSELENSWTILSTVDGIEPAIVEDVLMHPPTGVWLVRALRILVGLPAGQATVPHELHYLHSLAAAAAVRAGLRCTIRVPVTYGIVCLPTVGYVPLPAGTTSRFAELLNSAESTQVILESDATRLRFNHSVQSPEFIPMRRHHAAARGADLAIEVDDVTPYREFLAPEPPRRMGTAEWARWQRMLDDVWDLLTNRHAAYARELSAGLMTVAPIFSNRNVVGSSSNSAFGGIALSGMVSTTELAEVLVHELQHSKLNALLELVTLRHDDAGKWWYAPWRDDPRPLTGLLHGIYAFVSVVEFWRHQRGHLSGAAETRKTEFSFAYRRHQVRQAVDALRSAAELTPLGSQLVAAVSDRLASCEAESVSPELADTVALMEQDHRVTWRLHHLRPDSALVALLADAWLGEQVTPPLTPAIAHSVEPFHRSSARPATRVALLKAKAVNPGWFATHTRTPGLTSGSAEADTAFAVGDHVRAVAAYADRIRTAPQDVHAWAGLSVSLAPQTSAGAALRSMPETVLAVRDRIMDLGCPAPSPVDLADWLGRG